MSRESLDLAVREGRFTDAAVLRGRGPVGLAEQNPTSLELFYYLGHAETVRRDAGRMMETQALPTLDRSRAALVLAAQHLDDGSFDNALDVGRQSHELALLAQDVEQLCLTSAFLLERTCNRSAFDASLPMALEARRFAVRSGDAQVKAQVQLAFGRLEARVGHIPRARRHFAVCRELLTTSPNLFIDAAVDLDESSALSLTGDWVGALALAERAANAARISGWSKGVVAAAANSAFFLVALGRIAEAERHLAAAAQQKFHSPSYDLALQETKARVALAAGDLDTAERLLSSQRTNGDVDPWYELSASETLARILLRRGRVSDALEQLDLALAIAAESGAKPFELTLQLLRAEAILASGRQPDWRFLSVGSEAELPVNATASLWRLLAKAMAQGGSTRRARDFGLRAFRLSEIVGGFREEQSGPASVSDLAVTVLPSTDLDSAVALLDLGAHPHILARETVAVLEAAGCTRAIALLAGAGPALRVVETRAWDEREALAAARRSDGLDVIPLGHYRDEPWQILVDPKPGLDDRCTLIAIRKLVATATTLDRFRRDEKQRAALWPAEALDGDPDTIWASSQMAELLGIARRIAPAPVSVLLTGETGTGKEVLARTIHRASARADGVFLPFNCTAVPRDMIESQLFGYRKGAFTGADASFQGVIRSAAGGTLFLDEIAEVPVDLQPKLLRFLESHEIHPLGEPQPVKVDVRVIAATNAPLEQLVADGRLREDLFYRLNVVQLKLPPLRERREEIPPLVEHYLRKFADEQKKGMLPLSDEALEYLLLYAWPGNVRQLANEMHRVVALAEPGATVTPAMLSPEIRASRRTIPVSSAEPEIRLRIDQPLPAAVEMLEQTMVRNALDRSNGRVEEAARLLGISRKGLFLKRRRWGLAQRAS